MDGVHEEEKRSIYVSSDDDSCDGECSNGVQHWLRGTRGEDMGTSAFVEAFRMEEASLAGRREDRWNLPIDA